MQVVWDVGNLHHGGTEAQRGLENYLGPSFAVKAPLIQDDGLKRGEYYAAQLLLPQIYERNADMENKLDELVTLARGAEFSKEDKEGQRRSFAYGNVKIENDQITREMVAREAERLTKSSLDALTIWLHYTIRKP